MAIPSDKPSRAQARAEVERSRRGRRISHVVGFDDAPFERSHRGDVLVVGAVFAGDRLDGVISTKVRRDGANAAQRLIDCVTDSKYFDQLQAILLQGIEETAHGHLVVQDKAHGTKLTRGSLR